MEATGGELTPSTSMLNKIVCLHLQMTVVKFCKTCQDLYFKMKVLHKIGAERVYDAAITLMSRLPKIV